MNTAGPTTNPDRSGLSPTQWRQIGLITVSAVALFVMLRMLPTGTALSHMDFRIDSPNVIEFCDPSNPQFIPVVAVASPVSLSLKSTTAHTGKPVEATVVLKTANGKPIATEDLLVVHTKQLHLLIIDPTLTDYQHVHPNPTGAPGEWSFQFTPHASGNYRIFADFTPAATGRGLYATTDLPVASAGAGGITGSVTGTANVTDDYTLALTPANPVLRARQPVDLRFTVVSASGGEVPLEPVMDAYAHLVAFDQARSGFAHLHPMQIDPLQAPDRMHPALDFKVTIPSAGRYVVWAQVKIDGNETFTPFWFDVVD